MCPKAQEMFMRPEEDTCCIACCWPKLCQHVISLGNEEMLSFVSEKGGFTSHARANSVWHSGVGGWARFTRRNHKWDAATSLLWEFSACSTKIVIWNFFASSGVVWGSRDYFGSRHLGSRHNGCQPRSHSQNCITLEEIYWSKILTWGQSGPTWGKNLGPNDCLFDKISVLGKWCSKMVCCSQPWLFAHIPYPQVHTFQDGDKSSYGHHGRCRQRQTTKQLHQEDYATAGNKDAGRQW